jgi:hypothetical protein
MTNTPDISQELPFNQSEQGLIYDGLEAADLNGPCRALFRIPVFSPAGQKLRELCTHGPDPAPPGIDIQQDAIPAASSEGPIPDIAQCDGDGITGFRTEVIYARASDVLDRYGQYLTSFRQWVTDADNVYRESAIETGGLRRIRFVHDSNCLPVVRNVVLSPVGDDDFGITISELTALGYNRTDRKYIIFMDANVYCGIGTIQDDDVPGPDNRNNNGPSYGRTDAGCWNGMPVAHEHMHNLGGVQLSAPNASGGWHCTDEYDVMCYSDAPNYPPMNFVCTDPSRDSTRFDCNFNDYYNTNPVPGSYLDTHWNAANSIFLIGNSAPPDDFTFADDFELGNLSAWTASTNDGGDLSVTTITKYAGNYGMQALIDDNNAIFVRDDTPSSEPRYRARFYFNPNSILMASGNAHFIFKGFAGTNSSSTELLRVELRSPSSGVYEVRASLVNDSTSWGNTVWVPILNGWNAIELDWRAASGVGANNGGLTLWINGQERGSTSPVDNDTRRIDFVRLGALNGIDTATRGNYYFDAFESRRQTYIGP